MKLHLGASRLVQKLCRQASKGVAETDRIEALDCDGEALEEERRFTCIVGDEGKTAAERREKVATVGPNVSMASGTK